MLNLTGAQVWAPKRGTLYLQLCALCTCCHAADLSIVLLWTPSSERIGNLGLLYYQLHDGSLFISGARCHVTYKYGDMQDAVANEGISLRPNPWTAVYGRL